MAASKSLALIVAVLLAVVNLAPKSEGAVSCGTVVAFLSPCLSYLNGKGQLSSCCDGIRKLKSIAKTTPDRQSVCNCLKSLANSNKSFIGGAAALPGKCGVSIPYKISPSTDCSKVN